MKLKIETPTASDPIARVVSPPPRLPRDHRAGDAHDGDGDVGNDVRKREPQDFPIHKRGV